MELFFRGIFSDPTRLIPRGNYARVESGLPSPDERALYIRVRRSPSVGRCRPRAGPVTGHSLSALSGVEFALTKPDTRPTPTGTRRTHVAWQPPDVAALLAAAPALVDQPDAPFSTRSMWLSAWYMHFRAQPVAVCVWEGGEAVGLAFLAIQRRGPIRSVVLSGHGPGDYGRLYLRTADAAADLAQGIIDVLDRVRGPWRLVLAQLPVGDPVAAALTDALVGARLEPAQASPKLVFGEDRRIERVLSAATRRKARRGHARLKAAGVTPQVRRFTDPAQVREVLPPLIAVHRDRDHAVGRRSDLDPPARREFFADIVHGLADTGTLDLWVIFLDGAIGAYFIGVRDGACYRIVDGRMSGLWPTTSPALLLRHEMTATLLADPGVTEIDYMRGVLRHKTQDATDIVPAVSVLAESSRLVRHGVYRWRQVKRTVRECMSPAARGWIRSAQSRFAASRTDHRVQGRP